MSKQEILREKVRSPHSPLAAPENKKKGVISFSQRVNRPLKDLSLDLLLWNLISVGRLTQAQAAFAFWVTSPAIHQWIWNHTRPRFELAWGQKVLDVVNTAIVLNSLAAGVTRLLHYGKERHTCYARAYFCARTPEEARAMKFFGPTTLVHVEEEDIDVVCATLIGFPPPPKKVQFRRYVENHRTLTHYNYQLVIPEFEEDKELQNAKLVASGGNR